MKIKFIMQLFALTSCVVALTSCTSTSSTSNGLSPASSESNSSDETIVVGTECDPPNAVSPDGKYVCSGHGAFYWRLSSDVIGDVSDGQLPPSTESNESTSPTDNTSTATESNSLFSESKLRKALLVNCTYLPPRFGTMKFQEGTVIYDAYGMPWGTYALGGTHFAVRDDSSKWHISGMDQTSRDDLISWECETTFDISK